MKYLPRRAGMIVASSDSCFRFGFGAAEKRSHGFTGVVAYAVYYQLLYAWNRISEKKNDGQ